MNTKTIGLQPTSPQPAAPAFAPPATGPGKGIDRDRWGRPLIIPPRGGKPVPYTRCTTYVSALDDKENLMKWKARMTAIGMAQREDLILQVRSADPEDKETIGRAAEEAAEHAGAHRRAEIGTALHALTERLDRGETLPDLGKWQADIAAYRQATASAGLQPVEIETFVVNDELKIGGTFDRIYRYKGETYIGDIKTGSSLDWGAGTFAMQLAVYANSLRYNPTTGARTPIGVNTARAILVHLPAGEGKATLYWLDIAKGWHSVGLAKGVRDWRKLRKKDWLWSLTPPTLEDLIEAATTITELQQLFLIHQDVWTEEHTRLAALKKASLATV